MTRSNTNYRTAVVAPTAGDSIREAHSYEYDNNGNILYVNTSRVKPDMTAQSDTVQRAREERFRWDEENRLTALSQNGYVSHYRYDANGERDKRMPSLCHMGSTTAKETIAGRNSRTISHELGHSGGLKDTNKSNVDNVKLETNLMTQISALQLVSVPNPEHVKGLTSKQIKRIIKNKDSSNKKSAIEYKNFYIPTGYSHPMFGFPLLNKTRRKILKL